MKKIVKLLACLLVLLTLCACGGKKYTGTADGMHGKVEVTITVEDGKVTACEAKGDGETAELWAKVAASLPQAVVDGNSADVDAVAGATVSSKAFKAAAHEAFKAAGLE